MNPRELVSHLSEFRRERTLFEAPGAAVTEIAVGGIRVPRITNELWAAAQRQGHSLHEISYRACFKAELPRFFITRLSQEGDRILDPFLGRGTTLLEAALLDRVPCGSDVNPLSRILIEPRLDPPGLTEIRARLAEWRSQARDPEPDEGEPDLSVFYEEKTLADIRALRRWFLAREGTGDLDRVDRWLRMVATNRLTGHSSGFFSGRTMPPNQAVSVATQRKLNERLGLEPPRRDVEALILKKSRSLLRSLDPFQLACLRRNAGKMCLFTGRADRLSAVPAGSIQCTVTSPPFLDVVDYAKDNWLRCWFCGLDAERIGSQVTTSRRLEDWTRLIGAAMCELHRVTRPGGWVVFEVGEVRRGSLLLEEPVLPLARDAGFEPVAVVVHSQRFTKTANCWGVANNRLGTNTNRLVLLHKPGARKAGRSR
ncbi:MAG: DNA methyltransferase [Planctomycetota bacterium]